MKQTLNVPILSARPVIGEAKFYPAVLEVSTELANLPSGGALPVGFQPF